MKKLISLAVVTIVLSGALSVAAHSGTVSPAERHRGVVINHAQPGAGIQIAQKKGTTTKRLDCILNSNGKCNSSQYDRPPKPPVKPPQYNNYGKKVYSGSRPASNHQGTQNKFPSSSGKN